MPELPEVETVKNGLIKSIKDKTIKDVLIFKSNIINGKEKEFISTLKNKKILDIKRIGKHLIFKLNQNTILISHLGMEGKFIPGNSIKDKSKYVRVLFLFKDNTILNYDDSRMFGSLAIRDYENYNKIPPISEIGIEAIDNIDIEKIYPIVHKQNKPIKEVLLDQHIVSGIGNIYADETLFKSKIHPLSKAYDLTKNQVKELYKNAKEILLLAIKHNGSTVHSFTWDKGKSGDMQRFLKVYGKEGEKCPNCATPFTKIFIDGRGTTFCNNCQKLIYKTYALGITGPTSVGKSTALNELKKLGYRIYSSDEEVSKLYLNKDFKKQLIKLFNVYNKEEVRNIVSKDKNKLETLNKLIHPIIKKQIKCFVENNKGKLAIEVPLLFQCHIDKMMTENLLILSNKNNQFIKERGLKGKSQLKINNSLDYSIYIKDSTYIINNNSSLNDFKKAIKTISR